MMELRKIREYWICMRKREGKMSGAVKIKEEVRRGAFFSWTLTGRGGDYEELCADYRER